MDGTDARVVNDVMAVRAQGISKRFGDVVALDDVDLTVPAGQMHGLVGPNGAGKTTLLGVLLGLARPDAGSLEILGVTVGGGREWPEGLAGFVDGPGLYPSLTARQNLRATARLGGADPEDITAVLERVGLTDVGDDRVRGFSLGMRQRLGLAAALLAKPRLLVLDEPANGLDPAGARHVHGVLTDLAADGTSVVLSSHRMDDLASLCDEITILDRARVVFSGPVGTLATEDAELDYRVRTSDPVTARTIAATIRGLRLTSPQPESRSASGTLLVRGAVAAIDELVVRLVAAGIAVRELAPAMSPLEAGFLALTGGAAARDTRSAADADAHPDDMETPVSKRPVAGRR